MDKWIYDKLHSRFSHFKGLTALDLGCGEGVNAVGLAKLGMTVTAIDKQASMIKVTQELANKEQTKITVKLSKIQDFQSSSQYDVVIFTHVLHFISSESQFETIQKVIDLVKVGGTLIFADLEDNSPVSPEHILGLEKSFRDVETERFLIEDRPHLGANYPHQHKVFYLIGVKKDS